jgi:ATP/maltotriose-dependent transcriptional regulator MalT
VLAGVAEALAGTGEIARARHVVQHAEAIARSITVPSWRPRAMADVARALARAGDVDRAEAIAYSITSSSSIHGPFERARALAGVAEALAETGDLDRARQVVQQVEAIASSLENPVTQAEALAAVAGVLTRMRNNVSRSKNAINRTDSAASDVEAMRTAITADEERFQRLLASALIRADDHINLLLLLATIQPAVVIKAAENMSHIERPYSA